MKKEPFPSIILVMQKVLTLIIVSALLFAVACKKEETCRAASTANAGPDQGVSGTSTTLAGNKPDSGTGTWSIVSGAGGTIADASSSSSKFNGAIGTTYELKWAITGCPTSEDIVKIVFACASIANAGPDQNVSSGVTTALAANAAASGSGVWNIVSGTGGNIATPSSPTSQFSGVLGSTYVLRWTVACSSTQDDVSITFVNTNPQLISVDKTSVINGEIITITGLNFSANFNGGSQIAIVKNEEPNKDTQAFIEIISRTATEIKAVMKGLDGALGSYQLLYRKKPDANPEKVFPSNLTVSVTSPAVNQFFTSSVYTLNQVTLGKEASFGVKNGSLIASDYAVKIIDYNFVTGISNEITAKINGVTANDFSGGFLGSGMDRIVFTVPASLVVGNTYYVKVTYGANTLFVGWNELLIVQ